MESDGINRKLGQQVILGLDDHQHRSSAPFLIANVADRVPTKSAHDMNIGLVAGFLQQGMQRFTLVADCKADFGGVIFAVIPESDGLRFHKQES